MSYTGTAAHLPGEQVLRGKQSYSKSSLCLCVSVVKNFG